MTRDEAAALVALFAGNSHSGTVEAILAAAAAQRARDAAICRAVHLQSKQRVELALLCARMIEGDDD